MAEHRGVSLEPYPPRCEKHPWAEMYEPRNDPGPADWHCHACELERSCPPLHNDMVQIRYGKDVDNSVRDQGSVMLNALLLYANRNKLYKDNWRRYGWRGLLYDLRRKVERAWDHLWDATVTVEADPDDLLDCVNYAALACRAILERNRDGNGGWW